ncbi:MAG: hypothetical protein HeimC3_27610 [Candidatus Heimdallarchaeota archaeon LC_3]|nr:MAG: hypothetical protein HeimC3_27610 [Candidatus Heimdallarchaeota archaeon LC_3]
MSLTGENFNMSDDFLQSMESFLSTVQQELGNKIRNLNSRLDKLTETNQDLIRGFKEKNSFFIEDDGKFSPYRKVLELEEKLQKEKRKNYSLEEEISSYKKLNLFRQEPLNITSSEAADYI